MTGLKRMTMKYGGGCAVCHKWIEKDTEAYYDNGQLLHLTCVEAPTSFEDDVIDRLAEIHDRCKSIEDKLVSLGYGPYAKVEDAMGGKK